MGFRHNNPKFPYKTEYQVLEETSQEKNLGSTLKPNLYFDKHIRIVTGKSNKILGIITRSYDNKQKSHIMQLYQLKAWCDHILIMQSRLGGHMNAKI